MCVSGNKARFTDLSSADLEHPTASARPRSDGLYALAERLARSKPGHVALLVVMTVALFGRTLGNSFLADDFIQVYFVAKIVNGAWPLFWSNLLDNYMQLPSISVYRPWFLVTMLIDCLIWGTNAFGYYLTNLLYFTGVVILLYLTLCGLTASWAPGRSALMSFFAAALFATSPLHCESISWVVGRVDTVCCFYYLLSFFLFLRFRSSGRRVLGIGSGAAYFLGILTKEMAIGLPVVCVAVELLWPSAAVDKPTPLKKWCSSVLRAMRLTAPLWLATLIYLALRLAALKTPLGGYSGALGAWLAQSMAERLSELDTLRQIFLPLSYAVYHGEGLKSRLLVACYLVFAVLSLVRIMLAAMPWRWLVLLIVWALTAILPIYQLWGLGYNLEGSRMYFFLTMPLSAIWPLLVFFEWPAAAPQAVQVGRRLTIVGAAVLVAVTTILGRAAVATNALWIHAGREVRALAKACHGLVANTPLNARVVLLGLPKDRGGAHTFYNGEMFAYMLSPPFARDIAANKFYTFDPYLVGPGEYINSTRLKQCLSTPGVLGPYVWSGPAKGFVLVPLTSDPAAPASLELPVAAVGPGQAQPHVFGHALSEATAAGLRLKNVRAGDGIKITGLAVNPLDYDFLELEMRVRKPAEEPEVTLAWKGELWQKTDPGTRALWPPRAGKALFVFNAQDLRQATVYLDRPNPAVVSVRAEGAGPERFLRVRIRAAHYWRWYDSGKLQELSLSFSACEALELRNLRLRRGDGLMPRISLPGRIPSPSGVNYVVSRKNAVDLDGTGVRDVGSGGETSACRSLELEVTRPNYLFDSFLGRDYDQVVARRIKLDRQAGTVELDPAVFPSRDFYQFRARCLGDKGEPIAEPSDPVTVYFFGPKG